MMLPIFLCLSIFISSFDFINSQYDQDVDSDSFQRAAQNRLSGIDYGDFSEIRNHGNSFNRDLSWGNLPPGQIYSYSQLAGSGSLYPHQSAEESDLVATTSSFKLVSNWPVPTVQLGQPSAVSLDVDGNVVVFHRGDRKWHGQTFFLNNTYSETFLGPIKQNTVIVFNATTGQIIKEWGSNMFYLPHGLTVDSQNNVWVTDVALHQVFKFRANEWKNPVLTLGTKFEPGNDDTHFCKPTDIAILSNGDFFVSDGYCNSRIIKYDSRGQKLMEWGRSFLQGSREGLGLTAYTFSVPHALALAEEKGTLFLADREDGRILSFNITSGFNLFEIRSAKLGSRLYSVAYSPSQGGQLYIVNGQNPFITEEVGGFIVSLTGRKQIKEFTAHHFLQSPHDIAVTADGNNVYIVELDPYKIWKFSNGTGNNTVQVKGESSYQTGAHNVTSTTEIAQSADLKKSVNNPTSEKVITHPDHLGSMAMAVGVMLAVLVIISIIVIAAVTRMRKRGGSEKLGPEYSKLVE